MTTLESNQQPTQETGNVPLSRRHLLSGKNLRWFAVGWGILGLISIVLPAASTLAIEVVLAAILTFAGGYRVVLAWQNRGATSWRRSLVVGLLVAATGILMLASPGAGVMTLTMMLMIFFVLEAVLALNLAFELKASSSKWIWLALNGLFNILLVGFIIVGWPFTALWVPGLMLGISMLSNAVIFWSFATAV